MTRPRPTATYSPAPVLTHQPAPPDRRGPPVNAPATSSLVELAAGEKAKARDLLAAIRTLKSVEAERRTPTADERQALARFPGFGPVALSLFPDPVSGRYKDAGWEAVGHEPRSLLTPNEYASAKRTTFNAFYTSATVITAMYDGFRHLGVPGDATVLEPGCGPGRFLYLAPINMRFTGVEMDGISGRIARALFSGQDIRIENFRDSKLPEFDAVIHHGLAPVSADELVALAGAYEAEPLLLYEFLFPAWRPAVAVQHGRDWRDVPAELLGTAGGYRVPCRRLADSDLGVARLALAPGTATPLNRHPGHELLVPLAGCGQIRLAELATEVVAGTHLFAHYTSEIRHQVVNPGPIPFEALVARFYE